MKLTSRDKKLLMGLGIFIFIIVYVKFLMLPKISNIQNLSSQNADLNNSLSMNMTYKAKLNNTDSDIKIISKKLSDLRAIYPPSINTDELLVVVKDLLNKSELEVKKISFVDMAPVAITSGQQVKAGQNDQNSAQSTASALNMQVGQANGNSIDSKIANYFYILGLIPSQTLNNQQNITIPDGKGYSVAVDLELAGTNQQMKKFFDSLSKLKNKAYFQTVDLQSSGVTPKNEQLLTIKTKIQFYGIMDKGAGEYYLLPDGKWSPVAASGKDDIFKPYEGFTQSKNQSIFSDESNSTSASGITATDPEADNKYDFYVVSTGFGGSFLPSVSIGCNNKDIVANGSSPIVYGDKNGIENAEIFIEEKGGKYYFKIKTDHESYPDKQYSTTTEFVPGSKDIKIKIVTTKRSSDQDKAGLSINIINNTKKKVTYKILFDDQKLPRVKINKTVGDVKNE
jgi:type IV pilus assembly protein PilO